MIARLSLQLVLSTQLISTVVAGIQPEGPQCIRTAPFQSYDELAEFFDQGGTPKCSIGDKFVVNIVNSADKSSALFDSQFDSMEQYMNQLDFAIPLKQLSIRYVANKPFSLNNVVGLSPNILGDLEKLEITGTSVTGLPDVIWDLINSEAGLVVILISNIWLTFDCFAFEPCLLGEGSEIENKCDQCSGSNKGNWKWLTNGVCRFDDYEGQCGGSGNIGEGLQTTTQPTTKSQKITNTASSVLFEQIGVCSSLVMRSVLAVQEELGRIAAGSGCRFLGAFKADFTSIEDAGLRREATEYMSELLKLTISIEGNFSIKGASDNADLIGPYLTRIGTISSLTLAENDFAYLPREFEDLLVDSFVQKRIHSNRNLRITNCDALNTCNLWLSDSFIEYLPTWCPCDSVGFQILPSSGRCSFDYQTIVDTVCHPPTNLTEFDYGCTMMCGDLILSALSGTETDKLAEVETIDGSLVIEETNYVDLNFLDNLKKVTFAISIKNNRDLTDAHFSSLEYWEAPVLVTGNKLLCEDNLFDEFVDDATDLFSSCIATNVDLTFSIVTRRPVRNLDALGDGITEAFEETTGHGNIEVLVQREGRAADDNDDNGSKRRNVEVIKEQFTVWLRFVAFADTTILNNFLEDPSFGTTISEFANVTLDSFAVLQIPFLNSASITVKSEYLGDKKLKVYWTDLRGDPDTMYTLTYAPSRNKINLNEKSLRQTSKELLEFYDADNSQENNNALSQMIYTLASSFVRETVFLTNETEYILKGLASDEYDIQVVGDGLFFSTTYTAAAYAKDLRVIGMVVSTAATGMQLEWLPLISNNNVEGYQLLIDGKLLETEEKFAKADWRDSGADKVTWLMPFCDLETPEDDLLSKKVDNCLAFHAEYDVALRVDGLITGPYGRLTFTTPTGVPDKPTVTLAALRGDELYFDYERPQYLRGPGDAWYRVKMDGKVIQEPFQDSSKPTQVLVNGKPGSFTFEVSHSESFPADGTTAVNMSVDDSEASKSIGSISGSDPKILAPVVVAAVIIILLLAVVYRQYKKPKDDMESFLKFDKEWLVDPDCITIAGELGSGQFGQVHKGVVSKPFLETMAGVPVAVKTCHQNAMATDKREFIAEANLMTKFSGETRHPNVIRLLGVSCPEPLYIVVEFMENGDLREYLHKHNPTDKPDVKISGKNLLSMGRDVADGMNFLTFNFGFVHRDLACRNCLVDANLSVKLADFGMSRDVHYTDYYRKNGEALMPVRWMAPEALSKGLFTSETDVWAFGILFWEIWTFGDLPYPGMNNQEVYENVMKRNSQLNVRPRSCPRAVYDMMTKCWAYKQSERPTFKELLYDLELLMSQASEDAYIQINVDDDTHNEFGFNKRDSGEHDAATANGPYEVPQGMSENSGVSYVPLGFGDGEAKDIPGYVPISTRPSVDGYMPIPAQSQSQSAHLSYVPITAQNQSDNGSYFPVPAQSQGYVPIDLSRKKFEPYQPVEFGSGDPQEEPMIMEMQSFVKPNSAYISVDAQPEK